MIRNDVIAAFNPSQVEFLTGVGKRQLRAWARDGFYAPSLTTAGADAHAMTLYSFHDLMCLKVIGALRNETKISLSELKEAKDKLSQLGGEAWLKTSLWVRGNRIIFDDAEIAEQTDLATPFSVLQIPLELVTRRMEALVRAMRRRKTDSFGKITRTRNVAQNQPVLAGTRIPVRAIRSFAEAGYSVDQIVQQYPSLTEEDVKAALLYQDVA